MPEIRKRIPTEAIKPKKGCLGIYSEGGMAGAFILEEDRKWRPDLANVQTVEKCR